MEKCEKYGKNRVINGVIHFIHINCFEILKFTYFFSKQVFCLFLINLQNVDSFFVKNIDILGVKK